MFSWYWKTQTLCGIYLKSLTWKGLREQNFESPIAVSSNSFVKSSCTSFNDMSMHLTCKFASLFCH